MRVAVESFLDLIYLTIDTMDHFGWLLYCVIVPHAYTQHLYCVVWFCTVVMCGWIRTTRLLHVLYYITFVWYTLASLSCFMDRDVYAELHCAV